MLLNRVILKYCTEEAGRGIRLRPYTTSTSTSCKQACEYRVSLDATEGCG